MPTFASFVADEAIALVEAAAEEIGPEADDLGSRASTLVFDAAALARAMETALTDVSDAARLEQLAFMGLETYPAVVGTTANRNRQRANQTALIDLLRGLATVRFAEVAGTQRYRERTVAVARRDQIGDALDERAADANIDVFRELRALRAAVVQHVVEELRRLPPVIVATPATVQPSLALAYDVYDDIERADEIVGRASSPRPGFLPAQPITLPGG